MAGVGEKADLESRIAAALAELKEGCSFNITDMLYSGLIEDSDAFRSKMDEVLRVLKEMEVRGLVENAGDFSGVEFFRPKAAGGGETAPASKEAKGRVLEDVEEMVLAALKTGSASASDIAAKLFARDQKFRARTSQVYVTLKRLEKKGTVAKGEKAGKKQYYCLAAPKEETAVQETAPLEPDEEPPEQIKITVPKSKRELPNIRFSVPPLPRPRMPALHGQQKAFFAVAIAAIILLPFVFNVGGITGFFIAQDALQVSLESTQMGAETELTYSVRNVHAEPVTGVTAEMTLPKGSKITNSGGATVEETKDGYKLSWRTSAIAGGGVEKFAVRAAVKGQVKMFATGAQRRTAVDSLTQSIEATLGAGQHGYSQMVAEPKGYLSEISVAMTASPAARPIEKPIENVTENVSQNITAQNITEEAPVEENATEQVPAQNTTEQIPAAENITEQQPAEEPAEEQAAEQPMEEAPIEEEPVEEPEGPTGSFLAGEGGATIKIYLDSDDQWNGNEDLMGEQTITGEWSGAFKFSPPAGKYNGTINLVLWSDNGANMRINEARLTWSQDVTAEASGSALIGTMTAANETNVSFEKIEEDPRYDAIIDEATLSEDGTLTVMFHHNATGPMPVGIEGDVDYSLSTNLSQPNENVTLYVYGWTEEDYFEIFVGTATEVMGFGEPTYYDFDASVKDAHGKNVDVKIEFLRERTGKKLQESAGLAHALSVKEGDYKIKVTPTSGPVKEILLDSVNVNASMTQFINIDDAPETAMPDSVEVYAIDPTAVDFTSANVTVTAKGTQLFKCKDWNFTAQDCYGEWTLYKSDLVPGQDYTFALTPEDPGYAETNYTPNATHKAYFFSDTVLPSTRTAGYGTEYTAAQYTAASSSDNNWANFSAAKGSHEVTHYRFIVAENYSSIYNFTVTWEGYSTLTTSGTGVNLYLRNFTSSSWKLVANTTSSTEQTFQYSTSNRQDFINSTSNEVWIMAESVGGGLLEPEPINETMHVDFVGMTVGHETTYAFEVDVKDANNQSIEATVEFTESGAEEVKYSDTVSAEEIIAVEPKPINLDVAVGTYDIRVTPLNHVVQEIVFKNVSVYRNVTEFVKIDDPADNQGYLELYAIDPTALNFTEATVTIDNAKGNALYKCADWNFTDQSCSGEWSKYLDMAPGESYTFTITPEDPGFMETSESTNYLFDAADPQYASYKQMKNETVGGTLYTSAALSQSGGGNKCFAEKWIAPNYTSQTWVNGTWNFTIYGYCDAGSNTANLFARILKYNGSEYEVLNTSTSATDLCSDTSAPGSANAWSHAVPYSDKTNLSAGNRIGVQVCVAISSTKNKNMYIQWESTTASNVQLPNSSIQSDNLPQWSSQGQNTSTPTEGDAVHLSTYWTDDKSLSTAILSTNESGAWQNKTTYGSPASLSGGGSWSNFTWQNASVPAGTIVGWRTYANDSRNNFNVTNIMTFAVQVAPDITKPRWSNNLTSPASPATYSSGASYQFNITWTDNKGISNVILEFNGANYTPSQSGNVYYRTFTGLAADSYNYRWYANDTSNNWNSTSQLSYTINRASSSTSINFNPSSPQTYGTQTTATCSITTGDAGATLTLYRNGTGVSNPDVQTLGGGTYNYTCVYSQSQNYSASTNASNYLTINQASTTTTLYLDSAQANKTVTYGAQTNATAMTSSGSVTLYRNGQSVSNSDVTVLGAGTYNYTAYNAGDANYTGSSATWWVTVNQAANPVTLYLNGNKNQNATINYGTQSNATGTTLIGTANLYRDYAAASNPQIATLAAGTYAYKVNATGNANYSDNSTGLTYYLIINKVASSVEVTFSPSASETYGTQTTAKCGIVTGDATATITLYRNGSSVASGSGNQSDIATLAADAYNYSCVYGQSQNYSAGSSLNNYLTIGKAASTASLILSPSSPITYGTAATATCTDINPEAASNLYRDGALANGENGVPVVLGAAAYNYVCNATATQNYTAASNSSSYTVNQAATNMRLWLNGAENDAGQTYGTNSNATAQLNVSGLSYQLLRNGTQAASGSGTLSEALTLAGGAYNYTAVFAGNANYTGSSLARTLTINKASTTTNLYIDGSQTNKTVTYGAQTNVTATTSVLSATLYRNGQAVSNTDITVLGAGTYNYTAVNSGNENYTGSSTTWWITVNKVANPVNLYLEGKSNQNDTITYGTQSNATGTTFVGTSYLYRDGAAVSNSEIKTLAAGTYAYKVNATGDANYSDNTTGLTYYIIINKATSTASLTLSPTSPITYETATTASCSDTNPEATANLYRSGSLANAENGIGLVLPVGAWNYVCNVTTTQNYTAASNSSDYTVNKASTTTTLYVDSSQANKTVTYGTQTNATATTSVLSLTLYRNGQIVSSPDVTVLGAGTYNYTAYNAGNANYTGSSATWWITVSQAANPVSLYLNGNKNSNDTITYTAQSNATGTSTYLTPSLYRDGAAVSNPEIKTLAAGTYAYKVNATGNANYSDNSTGLTYYLIINKVVSTASLTLSSTSPITYETATTAVCSATNPEGTVKLHRNGTDVTAQNNTAVTLGVGGYGYVCNVTATQNYTSASNSSDYTVNKASTTTTLYIDGSQTNKTVTYGTQTNATAITSAVSLTLYRNGQAVANPDVTVLGAGAYNYTAVNAGNANYTGSSATWWVTVNKADNPVTLYLNGNFNGNKTIVYGTQSNATGVSTYLTPSLYRDGAAVSNSEVKTLAAGTYAYKVNATGNANYSDNSTGATYYLIINKVTSTASLTLAPSSPITYGTSTTAVCSATNPEGTVKLYRNGADVTAQNNTGIVLGADTYNYMCNVTETQNYTTASNSSGYTVNQAGSILTLTASPSWSETYGTQTNVSCAAGSSEVSPTLYRDGQAVSGLSDVKVLGAADYNYVCNHSATQNYTANSTGNTLTISKASTTTTLYIDSSQANKTITYGTQTNATAVTSVLSLTLYRNGQAVANPDVTVLGAGTYNYTAYNAGNANYTGSSVTWWVTVSQAANPVTLYLNGNKNSNDTITYTAQSNATGTSTYLTPSLYRDGAAVSNSEVDTLAAGTYAYKVNATGNANYSDNSTGLTYYLIVNKKAPSIALLLDGAAANVTMNYDRYVNITAVLSEPSGGTIHAYRNGTQIASGNTWFDDTLGNYNITAAFYENENYTEDSITRWVTAVDWTPPSVSEPRLAPNPIYKQNSTTITANVTDHFGINGVEANVLYSNGTSANFAMADQGNGTWSYQFTPGASAPDGIYNITIIATDNYGIVNNSAWGLLDVNFVDRAPVLNLISNITVNELETASISATASDPDNDTLVYSYSGPFNSTGQWQTWYDSAGYYRITVTVSDRILTDSQDVYVTVNNVEGNVTSTIAVFYASNAHQFNLSSSGTKYLGDATNISVIESVTNSTTIISNTTAFVSPELWVERDRYDLKFMLTGATVEFKEINMSANKTYGAYLKEELGDLTPGDNMTFTSRHFAAYPNFNLYETRSGEVCFDLTGVSFTQPSRKTIFKCGWDFDANNCTGGWTQTTGGMSGNSTYCANVSSFSAFVLGESQAECGDSVCNGGETCAVCPSDCGTCPSGGGGGGGGGGGAGGETSPMFAISALCAEEWTCTEWSECTNGFQTRLCTDQKDCGSTVRKPFEVRRCRIIPTCFDGIQNQNETGTDCGGECEVCMPNTITEIQKVVGNTPLGAFAPILIVIGAMLLGTVYEARNLKNVIERQKKMLPDIYERFEQEKEAIRADQAAERAEAKLNKQLETLDKAFEAGYINEEAYRAGREKVRTVLKKVKGADSRTQEGL